MRLLPMFCAAFAAVGISYPAFAEDLPNMVGTWKGNYTGVHVGATLHRKAEAGVNFGKEMEFVLVIAEQHGRDFAGELRVGEKAETLIGSIHPGNKGGIMLDSDGQYFFDIVDSNTIDNCYLHTTPNSKVTGCARMTR